MLHAFMNGECKYKQQQQRFKKDNGNITIIDFEMTYKLRLSRSIIDNGQFALSFPYKSLYNLRRDYSDHRNHLVYN